MFRALVLWYSIAGRVLPASLPVLARAGHEEGSARLPNTEPYEARPVR